MSFRARCGPPSRIRGSLAIVLALAVLLGAQLCIIWVFSSAGFRQYERVSANLRAIYLAERVFSQTMARLKARPWSDRWFRGKAVTEKSVALERGSYSSYIATVPHPEKKLADVWIEARYEGAIVPMYWRVHYVDNTLDLYAQLRPQFFSFVPEDLPPPIGAAGAGPLVAAMEEVMNRQQANLPRAIQAMKAVEGIPSLARVLDRLGVSPGEPVLDLSFPAGNAPAMSQPLYLTIATSNTPPPATPVAIEPPAPQAPADSLTVAQLASRYPEPTQFGLVVRDALAAAGIDVLAPTRDYFDAPAEVRTSYDRATQGAPGLDAQMSEAFRILNELSDSYAKNLRRGNTALADRQSAGIATLVGYMRSVTETKAASLGRPGPDAALVDPAVTPAERTLPSPEESAAERVFTAYGRWWSLTAGLGQGQISGF